MSLTHLYKDLRELGVYSDIIKKNEIVTITGEGLFPSSEYYGEIIEVTEYDNFWVMRFFDRMGKYHRGNNLPSIYKVRKHTGDLDVMSGIVNSPKDYNRYEIQYYIHGERHRIGGPSIIVDYMRSWHVNGVETREEAPSRYHGKFTGNTTIQWIGWKIDGKNHPIYPHIMSFEAMKAVDVNGTFNIKYNEIVSRDGYDIVFNTDSFTITNKGNVNGRKLFQVRYNGDLIHEDFIQ